MAHFCSTCGKELDNGAYCPSCGRRTSPARKAIAIGAVSFLILLILTVWLISMGQHTGAVAAEKEQAAIAATPILHTAPLSRPAFIVAPGQYNAWPFTITPSMRGATITGHFVAQGGANDIVVLVLDADGLQNFSNGHEFRAFYDSGKVTTDTLNVGPLSPGSYYLVFSNAYSVISNKAVTSSVGLRWYQ